MQISATPLQLFATAVQLFAIRCRKMDLSIRGGIFLVRFTQIWSDLVRFGQIWSDLVRFGQIWSDFLAAAWPVGRVSAPKFVLCPMVSNGVRRCLGFFICDLRRRQGMPKRDGAQPKFTLVCLSLPKFGCCRLWG